MNREALGSNLCNFKREMEVIAVNHDAYKKNKDTMKTLTRMQWEEVDYGSNVTKCIKCAGIESKGHGMCHKGCAYGNDSDKRHCCVMSDEGWCRRCGCSWNDHVNSRKIYKQ